LRHLLGRELTTKQRVLMERELKFLSSGEKGEESSAYYINFHFKNSQRWVVIHDLRVRYEDFVAQIDHLLINRFLDIYVLESKNFYYGIKISPESEFLVWSGKTYVGIESPIEQNRRHVHLLEKVIARAEILPTRLGIPMSASFYEYVLIGPNSRIDRPSGKNNDSNKVIKADALVTAIEKHVDGMGLAETVASGAKMISIETLETFARELVKRHRPAKTNYAKKFGLSDADEQSASKSGAASSEEPSSITATQVMSMPAETKQDGRICPTCGASMVKRVAKKGVNAGNQFWGCSRYPKCKGIVPCE